MKFLHLDGDSVVSLRFVYQEVPTGNYEESESASDKLTFDTVGEIQDALADLFENKEAPFDLQDQILDLDAIRAEGSYTQADMVNQLAAFQNSLNGTLSANGEFPDIADFMDALQAFMDARAIDLGEFEEESSLLRGDVEQYAAHVEAGAKALSERAALSAMVEATIEGNPNRATEIGLNNELQRNEGGEVGRVATASTVGGLDQNLGETIASLYQDTAGQLNMSPDTLAAQMAAFDAMEKMQA